MNDQQKQTAKTFDAYGSSYSATVNDAIGFIGLSVDFFTRVKAEYILDVATEKFADLQQVSALDVGCGVGNFHGLLAPHFQKTCGVDVSNESIIKARENNPGLDYVVYEGSRLPYDEGEFDLVFSICVMHHVPPENWPGFVAEMKRVLRPGGMALVFEHNPRNPLTMRAVNNCPFDEDAVLLRSEKTTELFGDAGFDNVESRFILSVPAANRFLRGVDRVFSGLPFGAQYYVRAENA